MYIGKTPTVGNFQKCDAITTSATADYTLQVSSVNVSPESVNHMIVSLNGVIQAPTTAYTVSGATLSFASALTSADVIDFVLLLGNVLDVGTPTDNTVATAKIQDDAVTLAKMAAGTDGNIISYDASGNPVAIATGNDGQVLTSAGAGQPPAFEAAGGGSWTLIEAQTASSDSLIEFVGQFSATYDIYKIFATNVQGSADTQPIYLQWRQSGSYLTSTYRYACGGFQDDATVKHVGSTSASFINLSRDGTGNASGETQSFEITLCDPLGTDNTKGLWWNGYVYQYTPRCQMELGAGMHPTIAAVDGIKFYFNSGTFDGEFGLYGLAKS